MSGKILSNKRVLVAEDSALDQAAVEHALLQLGASVDIVGNCNETIEKLKSEPYNFVLIDTGMRDAYETTVIIRRELNSDVPIIALVTEVIGEEQKCSEYGLNGYLSKPLTGKSLEDLFYNLLSAGTEMQAKNHILKGENVAIDVTILYEISGHDEPYIVEMVKTFLETMPDTIDKIEQGLEKKNWETVYKSAHYAKSSLSVIKIEEMYNWALEIEMNAKRQKNLELIPNLLSQLKEKFKVAERVLCKNYSI